MNKNANIWSKLRVTPIEDEVRENRLQWFAHAHRSWICTAIKELIVISYRYFRWRRRFKKTYIEAITYDIKALAKSRSN